MSEAIRKLLSGDDGAYPVTLDGSLRWWLGEEERKGIVCGLVETRSRGGRKEARLLGGADGWHPLDVVANGVWWLDTLRIRTGAVGDRVFPGCIDSVPLERPTAPGYHGAVVRDDRVSPNQQRSVFCYVSQTSRFMGGRWEYRFLDPLSELRPGTLMVFPFELVRAEVQAGRIDWGPALVFPELEATHA